MRRSSAPTAEQWLDALPAEARFDLAFCDPPYAFDGWEALLSALPADLVVAESDGPVTPPPQWDVVREARYGGTWVGLPRAAPTGLMSGSAG